MATVQPIYFDDTTNKQGICQDIDFICGSNSVNFPKTDKVRLVNLGLDSVADLIQRVSANWAWDDDGQSNLPIAYGDFTANQQDYQIDITFLKLREVYVNQGSDTYKKIDQVDSQTILEDTATSTCPTGFYLYGNSIYFTPIPSATTTGNSTTLLGYGFKLLFERNIKYFATDDTTATAGYNPQFYRLASLYACRDYAIAKGKSNLNAILLQIDKMEKALVQNYSTRDKTINAKLIPNIENCR